MKSFVIFCEGIHDVYFLYRILKKMGFKSFNKKIKDMPSPLNKYFPLLMKDYNYEEYNILNINPLLPFMIKKDDQLILLYAIKGDTRDDNINSIVNAFIDFPSSEEDLGFTKGSNNITETAFIFFYDADDKGINYRITELKGKLSETFRDIENIEHGKFLESENHHNIGCYIFADNTEKGKLEDITLPLMTLENEPLFEDIKIFLEKHDELIPTPQKKHFQKATIGIAGQLTHPGSSNAVILRRSNMITEEKINDSPECNSIIGFFSTFLV